MLAVISAKNLPCGRLRKVVLRAQKALKTHPGHVGLHALAGFSAQQLGDDRTAEALLSKAAQLAQTEGSASVELPLGRANWAPCAGCAALCGVPEKNTNICSGSQWPWPVPACTGRSAKGNCSTG